MLNVTVLVGKNQVELLEESVLNFFLQPQLQLIFLLFKLSLD